MSKVEEEAYKAYPYNGDYRGQGDSNSKFREAYINGYHQAEKDLELTWEDLATIEKLGDDFVKHNQTPMSNEEFYKEILKRYKETKK